MVLNEISQSLPTDLEMNEAWSQEPENKFICGPFSVSKVRLSELVDFEKVFSRGAILVHGHKVVEVRHD